ncbi:MAG TPA: SsrA-binding protein SmpB [Candidatus Polarisedimenticolia bacterium]|nr:SsrA-binding protein SmpB [Candidatus Polarisedimenticolia bacterium]
MKNSSKEPEGKVLASNRRALHEFHVDERHEAGLVLLGTEVKSLRTGSASLQDAFARVERGEAFLHNCHIPPYSHGGYANHDPLRTRKLLLHRPEILRLAERTRSGGATIIPLRIYLSNGRIKITLAVARAKKLWDKREDAKRRDLDREARAARARSTRGGGRDRDED